MTYINYGLNRYIQVKDFGKKMKMNRKIYKCLKGIKK